MSAGQDAASRAAPMPPAAAEARPAQGQLRFDPQELWDFTLTTGDGVVLKVHKAILAQRTGFFASLFTAMRECGCLDLPESMEELLPLLQVLYAEAPTPVPAGSSAACSIALWAGKSFYADNPRAALEVGRKYDCRVLLKKCESFMTSETFKNMVMHFALYAAHLRLAPGSAPATPGASTSHPAGDARLTPFSCLALAQTYNLPLASAFWRAQVLANACQLTEGWSQPGTPAGGRAEAVQQLAELRVEELASLAADVLELAGRQAKGNAGLRHQAAQADKQRRKLAAFRQAVEEHVREFPGARDVRAAIKADVHAVV